MLTAVFIPIPRAEAEGMTFVGSFAVTNGTNGIDYSYENNVLTVLTSTALTIANYYPPTPTTDTIAVKKDISANITLNDVNINVSETENACAFKIADNSAGNVTITLAEDSENTLESGENCAGLQKSRLLSTTDSVGTLTISSPLLGEQGKLTATGGKYGAGIGGDTTNKGSNITIDGGTVTATGKGNGAGIGASNSFFLNISGDETMPTDWCTNIIITGGSVKAVGGANAPSIG